MYKHVRLAKRLCIQGVDELLLKPRYLYRKLSETDAIILSSGKTRDTMTEQKYNVCIEEE